MEPKDVQKGVFIVIESADEAYLSGVFGQLHDHFESQGHAVFSIKFPRLNQAAGHFAAKYQDGEYGDTQDISPYTATLYSALDHYDAEHEISRALNDGSIVLASGYSGAVMAHEGAKLKRSEERRGYFLWNESVEYEMLKIRRPDRTLVLRTGGQLSNSEPALPEHTSPAIVYEDICSLFPKDFQQIDCVRDGELMAADACAGLLAKVLHSLLPSQVLNMPNRKTRPAKSAELYPAKIAFSASQILQDKIIDYGYWLSWTRNPEAQEEIYVPNDLDHQLQSEFRHGLVEISEQRTTIEKQLIDYLELNSPTVLSKRDSEWKENILSTARETTETLVPVATSSFVELSVPDPRAFITTMASIALPEANHIAGLMNEQSGQMKLSSKAQSVNADLEAAATTTAPASYDQNQQEIAVVAATPRNEYDLIADILYEFSNFSLGEIRQSIDEWNFDQKDEILQKWIQVLENDNNASVAILKLMRYNLELTCDYRHYRMLCLLLPNAEILRQPLTPRYGYEVPTLIEDAGLADDYEKCFDQSWQLYSSLQASSHAEHAQYTTLKGHKLRCILSCSARDIMTINQQPGSSISTPTLMSIVSEICNKVAEVHPSIGQLLAEKFASSKHKV